MVVLAIVALSICLWTTGGSSSLTRGFPSLEELKRNGSLLDRFSTHDGEIRGVPGLTFNCPGPVQITKVTFIALPGPGEEDDDEEDDGEEDNIDEVDRPEIVIRIRISTMGSPSPVRSFELEHEMLAFGQFGYEHSVNMSVNLSQSDVETPQLWITHPPYVNSTLRLLHQARNICWRYYVDSNPQSLNCQQDFDYPLLAIETDPPGCIEGLVSAKELRRQWENRSLPVLYTSPEREISLNCPDSGSSTITQITVGAYQSFNIQGPQITIYYSDEDIRQECNVSTQPISEGVNVFECNIVDISVEEEIAISIYQRNSVFQIGFLHDGEDDTPLIHIDGYCGSNQLLSAEELVEKTQNHILNITERIEDTIEFPHLNITGDGQLVKWTFVARFAGMGQNYPQLSVLRQVFNTTAQIPVTTIFIVENKNCTTTVYPNVYECNVDQSVKAGDFVSLNLPAPSDAKLLLSFILNGAPPGMSLTGGGDDEGQVPGLPLISLKINPSLSSTSSPIMPPTPTSNILQLTTINTGSSSRPSPTGTATPTDEATDTATPTDEATDTATPTDEATDPQSNIGTVVGVVMGLLIAILLVLIVVVFLLFILYRRRSSQYKTKEEDKTDIAEDNVRTPMDNPVYSGRNSEPARLTRNTHYQYPDPDQPPPPPVNSNSQVYEVPDVTPSNGERKTTDKSFDNPDYYSSIQDIHSNTDNNTSSLLLSSNHYEMAIYVPTQEQRKYVESGEVPSENIYATLEESQAGSQGRTLSFFEECDTYWKPASNKEELYEQLSQRKYREIPKHHIRITEHLGSGQFGTVNKGIWGSGGPGGKGGIEVAVKMLQEGISEQDTVRFLQEAAINGQFRHPNIVQLLGVVTVGKPVMIVLELVSNGDLRDYLLKHKPTPGELPPSDTSAMLSQFCVQVARGMKYLSGKAFVHRDLAARNILVTDTKTCKISDFGMARDLEEGTYYVSHGGKIPVKWTAPEALHYKKYSTASDVWSFGCLMYEIWSLGHKPFEGYTNPDTIKLIDNGCRLAPPPGCPLEMYRLMISCWNVDKGARPQFREIVETLSQPEDLLLHIPEEVTEDHPQASILGAPLEAGRNLYTELQNTYIL